MPVSHPLVTAPPGTPLYYAQIAAAARDVRRVLRTQKPALPPSLAEAFWARVARTAGCWEWTGALRGGYGHLVVAGSDMAAHRLAWELANGTGVPNGRVVCHRCDNPRCVRPDHLFVATQRQNIRDAVRKGRHSSLFQAGRSRRKTASGSAQHRPGEIRPQTNEGPETPVSGVVSGPYADGR
jgi:hypothetical protein